MLNSHRLKTLLILIALLGLFVVSNFWAVTPRVQSATAKETPVTQTSAQHLSDALWRDKTIKATTQAQRTGSPNKFRALTLDTIHLQTLLQKAPREFTPAARSSDTIISLPMPDGTFVRFKIQHSPIMEEALAARFPQIRTFSGQSVDGPPATTRFDWTPQGLHGIILTTRGTVLIEPDGPTQTSEYIAYFQGDAPAGAMECAVTPTNRRSFAG